MAKSSRSNWKKLHRRIKASAEAPNVKKRVESLHKKSKLIIQGKIGNVPTQEPERRFYFKNPDGKDAVSDKINRSNIDFSKPLHLPPLKTNPYGKSDSDAPHPATLYKETVDSYLPIAGHAWTKDHESKKLNSLKAVGMKPIHASEDNSPVEFILGCNDAENETSPCFKKSNRNENNKSSLNGNLKLKSMQSDRKGVKGNKKLKNVK